MLDWIDVADAADLAIGGVKGVAAAGKAIAIYRLEEGYFATDERCTHAGALLSAGEVVECYIECPVHYGLFDVRTGKAQGAPVTHDLRTYPVRIEGGRVLVGVEAAPA